MLLFFRQLLVVLENVYFWLKLKHILFAFLIVGIEEISDEWVRNG